MLTPNNCKYMKNQRPRPRLAKHIDIIIIIIRFQWHVQNTNFVCSNTSLNRVWLSTKFIYMTELDTLLQLLIENKAYYLEIKAGLLQYLEGFWTSFLPCFEEKILNLEISNCRRTNPTPVPRLCVSKSMNPEMLGRERKAQGKGGETNRSQLSK